MVIPRVQEELILPFFSFLSPAFVLCRIYVRMAIVLTLINDSQMLEILDYIIVVGISKHKLLIIKEINIADNKSLIIALFNKEQRTDWK